ncbi:hypothetical protein NP493_8561g00001 [Ridgeia piscesae]|uniref:Serpin domain-containing protein n=1 Tax=Ridgeia piscesae TaxID=27915 RepID=A0AAD9INX6_RIDPI|nr:hypothetical protein NP493_8561g00001 [Ridgeia piscesae]
MRNQLLFLGVVLLLVSTITSSYRVWRLAQANGHFAFCLYNKLIQWEDGHNAFFSPISVSTALAMTYAGARGQTAFEMSQVLGFSSLKFNVHPIFRATLGSLNAGSDGQYKLTLANGVFLTEGLSVRLSFKRLISKFYSAGFEELDFAGDPQGTADYINQWVEDRTNGKIKDIVSPDLIQQSVMALANAIYFKGFWKCPFNTLDTRPAPFKVSRNQEVSVNTMIQTARLRYSMNRRLCCQIVELPYEGDRLAMYILLPTETDGLAALESKLTFQSLTSALPVSRTLSSRHPSSSQMNLVSHSAVALTSAAWHKETCPYQLCSTRRSSQLMRKVPKQPPRLLY